MGARGDTSPLPWGAPAEWTPSVAATNVPFPSAGDPECPVAAIAGALAVKLAAPRPVALAAPVSDASATPARAAVALAAPTAAGTARPASPAWTERPCAARILDSLLIRGLPR